MAERGADWMAQARRDLEHARTSAEAGHPEWACFAAQQAAEKGVKAVLERRLHAEARGHSVERLLQALADSFEVPDHLLAAASDLDKAYLPTRYPNMHPAGTPAEAYKRHDAEGCIGHADEILRFCDRLLSGA